HTLRQGVINRQKPPFAKEDYSCSQCHIAPLGRLGRGPASLFHVCIYSLLHKPSKELNHPVRAVRAPASRAPPKARNPQNAPASIKDYQSVSATYALRRVLQA